MAKKCKDNSGSLTREKFLLSETCIVAGLRLAGVSEEEIIRRAVDENVFRFPTTKMSKDIARVCLRRLNSLDSQKAISLLANGTPDQQRQTNIYTMMRHYDLVRCFMVDEIGGRFRMLDYTFEPMNMNAFFTRYLETRDSAQTWAESTQKRIKSVLMHILREGGYLESTFSTTLVPPFLDYEVEEAIRANGDTGWLPAFNCMEV